MSHKQLQESIDTDGNTRELVDREKKKKKEKYFVIEWKGVSKILKL